MVLPKVSVIVPFYNSEATLLACLESLRAQTLKNIEIILVDDGSSDNSLKVANEFASSYEGVCVVLSQSNKGPSAARNAGLDVAQGEFIAFVDSDDTVDATMYEKMYASAEKHASDIVSCGRVLIDVVSGRFIREKVPGYDVLKGSVSECPDIVKRVGPLMCDKMFRRSIIENNGIRFDEDIWYAEDFLFGTRVKIYASCVSAVQEALYRYIQADGSITSGTGHIMDIPKVCRRVVALYEQAGLLEKVTDQLIYVLVGYYLRRCRTIPATSNLWRSYKKEMKALFEASFSKQWKKVIARRIMREDSSSSKIALLWKALS